ncbi:hypothetical protein PUR_26740 [Paenibacillus sp. URB8-2]|nr:hypothetical protein PUR_26740 [Paenibacillus sp. URB8-2]
MHPVNASRFERLFNGLSHLGMAVSKRGRYDKHNGVWVHGRAPFYKSINIINYPFTKIMLKNKAPNDIIRACFDI